MSSFQDQLDTLKQQMSKSADRAQPEDSVDPDLIHELSEKIAKLERQGNSGSDKEMRRVDEKFTRANKLLEQNIASIIQEQKQLKSQMGKVDVLNERARSAERERSAERSSGVTSAVENEVRNKLSQLQKDLKNLEKRQFEMGQDIKHNQTETAADIKDLMKDSDSLHNIIRGVNLKMGSKNDEGASTAQLEKRIHNLEH